MEIIQISNLIKWLNSFHSTINTFVYLMLTLNQHNLLLISLEPRKFTRSKIKNQINYLI